VNARTKAKDAIAEAAMIVTPNSDYNHEIAKESILLDRRNTSEKCSKAGEYKREFLFKELNSESEFIQMFTLRYLVYRYVNFIEPNRDHLDIDCYDLFSTFLGAFDVTGSSKRLIGTVRIISGDKETPNADIIKRIIASSHDYVIANLLDRPALFPIMETFHIPLTYLQSFYNGRNAPDAERSKPFEISRLAILPELWGSDGNIETGLHDLIILNSWKPDDRKNIFFIATHPRTRRRYKKIGFKNIPGTRERLYKNLKQLAVAMILDLDRYLSTPNPYGKRCTSVFPSYQKKGYFKRHLPGKQLQSYQEVRDSDSQESS